MLSMGHYFDELEVLGLNPSQKKIILVVSKMGRSVAQIVRLTEISRSSVVYMLQKLHEKSFVFPVTVGKKKFWRSNIPKVLLKIKNIHNAKESKKRK
jgi:sugar-specific transcriptional regulator TrmB